MHAAFASGFILQLLKGDQTLFFGSIAQLFSCMVVSGTATRDAATLPVLRRDVSSGRQSSKRTWLGITLFEER